MRIREEDRNSSLFLVERRRDAFSVMDGIMSACSNSIDVLASDCKLWLIASSTAIRGP